MEIASLFRPEVKIEDGLVTQCEEPASTFYCSPAENLILFNGREPNLRWREYADCLLTIMAEFNVRLTCFIGSVAGLTPHTREPRVYCGISDESLRPLLQHHDLVPSSYEGPGSFVTYLITRARERDFKFVSLVTEIPAYVQGKNYKCIAAAARKAAAVLELDVDLGDITTLGKDFEKRLNETVRERPELAEQIRNIEKDYDHQVFHSKEDDLKEWLEKQGISLD
jgi:proteasome assembly chaperone (PAC2) family protein